MTGQNSNVAVELSNPYKIGLCLNFMDYACILHNRKINDRLSFYMYCDNHAEILLNTKVNTISRS